MPGQYGRIGGRQRPLGQILNPELPASPTATDSGVVTDPVTPIEEALGSGDGSGPLRNRQFGRRGRGDRWTNRHDQRMSPLDEVLNGGNGDEVLDGGNGDESEENPYLDQFMEVYEATKVGELANLADIQKQMSESFAHKGGYFGGKHAIAQSNLAAKSKNYLDQLLAETQLDASERQYEDWKRAREETMNLANLIPLLLDTEMFENIVSEAGPGASELLAGILGEYAGGVGGGKGSVPVPGG